MKKKKKEIVFWNDAIEKIAKLRTPRVSNSAFKCADPKLQPDECEKWRGCFDCPFYRQS